MKKVRYSLEQANLLCGRTPIYRGFCINLFISRAIFWSVTWA